MVQFGIKKQSPRPLSPTGNSAMAPHPPHRKRCHRYNVPGQFHCLTFSCFKRQPFLTRDRACQWLVDSITAARRTHRFRLTAWVFMPEHVHLLIYPEGQQYNISRILSGIKLPVSIRACRWVKKNAPAFLGRMLDVQPNGKQAHRFWQRGGGYDRNIRSAEELWEKIRYIHLNPVRRKLVGSATDWPWSSAADYAHLRQGPLKVDNGTLPWVA